MSESAQIKDPFASKNISKIWLYWSKPLFVTDKPHISGEVEFTNGETKGAQSFKADTFEELVTKVRVFVDSMPVEPKLPAP